MSLRVNTLGILLNNGRILLEEREGNHSEGTGTYYRPIGGTIEFGEKSDQAIVREFYEEIGAAIKVKHYMTCVENIFFVDKKMGHEISQIYSVEFVDSDLYLAEKFVVTEGQQKTIAKWIDLDDIMENRKLLFPKGLRDLLKKS
ncbi:ADP-ribose pyrophosphatase YjhB (NUDIX family) [Fictibacillus halophilus]|uniref:ADP-ribose pyrophosphatase YjhB (NUDIX family) n=1 Tax=Fictibacillus halophilus TaxID=1610490 RepID=A0ABV2LLG7_9BACL|nr:NUDIX domain-containing protein [Fictibacillus halophilus]